MALRRQRPTGAQIARDQAVSPATASRILRRHGLSRVRDLEPPEPGAATSARPGEPIHIDKLGRFARTGHRITGDRTRQSSGHGIGWEYLHLAVDDHARLAYSEVHPEEQRGSCLAFLFRYNWQRPHGGINGSTSISRIALPENNLSMLHS